MRPHEGLYGFAQRDDGLTNPQRRRWKLFAHSNTPMQGGNERFLERGMDRTRSRTALMFWFNVIELRQIEWLVCQAWGLCNVCQDVAVSAYVTVALVQMKSGEVVSSARNGVRCG
jgi:hypothetical protein